MSPVLYNRDVLLSSTLRAFTAGYVDTVGFVALFGLFTAHVTGNFVLIGASVAHPMPGVIGKLLALPMFIIGVASTRYFVRSFERKKGDARAPLMSAELISLMVFMAAGVWAAPFSSPNSWPAIAVGLLGVYAMAIQNAASRTAFAHVGPTTVMTGNVTQIIIDAVDLCMRAAEPGIKERLHKTWPPVLTFSVGAISGGTCFLYVGFLSLLVPSLALALLLIKFNSAR